MSDDHDGVPELLAAWAFGALQPADEQAVPLHLAGCESCAAEAERLRETVRLLDGPPGVPEQAAMNNGSALSEGVLGAALRARPTAPRVAPHAAPYAAAVTGLNALLREVDGHAAVGHSRRARLGRAGHGRPSDRGRRGVGPAPRRGGAHAGLAEHAGDAVGGGLGDQDRRHDRVPADALPEETVAAWSAQSAALLATPEARDAERASHATTMLGVRLPVADHFLGRAFETWIHTVDIGRALGLAVPPPMEAHLGQMVRLAVRMLGMALGPAAPPVLFAVTGVEDDPQWVLGSEGEPVRGELALTAVDFCLLVGGRHTATSVPRGAVGDEDAVHNVLERAASLAWL